MTDTEHAQWNRIGSRGRVDYVLRIGIALYGCLFSLIVLAARFTVFRAHTHWNGVGEELLQFVLEAILFGLWSGFWTWRINEKRYAFRQAAGPAL